MKKETMDKLGKRLFSDPIYFYIVIMAGIIFLYLTFRGSTQALYANYLVFPALLFWGAVLERKTVWKRRWTLVLPLLMVAWFLLLQLRRVLANEEVQNVGLFLIVYLFAFPLASLLQDEKKVLKIFALVYLAAAAALVVDASLLLADRMPAWFDGHVFWNGARLQAFWHPNIAACLLMIGIVFCTSFFADVKFRWAKLALVVLIALMLGTMALTNCRTIMILTGGYLGAQIFFGLLQRRRKWFVLGLVATLVVTIGFFVGAKNLYRTNEGALIEKQQQTALETAEVAKQGNTAAQTEQVKLEAISPQGTFWKDFGTLNNRTRIWESAFTAIHEKPEILLWGITEPGAYVSSYNSFPIGHLHNAWIECLAALGIVGFVIAMLFTAITVWNCLIVLLLHHQDIWRRNVALLELCLLVASVLEPYLFCSTVEYHVVDLLFFLCAGFLVHWQEADNRRFLLAIRKFFRMKA